MTYREAVNSMNEQIAKSGIDAKIFFIYGCDSDKLTLEEVDKLDNVLGNKLNLVHSDHWHPEDITKEEAETLHRGLGLYRSIVYDINREEMNDRIRAVIEKLGEVSE